MKNLISERFALNGLLVILSLVVVFHFLILLEIIPFKIVWGGRLENRSQMVRFEIISILINLAMLAVVALRAGFIKMRVNASIIRAVFWLMSAIFFLNTLGNLFSKNEYEKLVFTPLTLILLIFCIRIALSKTLHK
ncbi:MAG: hypothetical protein ACXWCG_07270 [Flavitalea sp.]